MQNNYTKRSSRTSSGNRGGGAGAGRFKTSSAPRNAPNGGGGGGAGNAKRNYERYVALARAAALDGDPVEMENCYQHAEHYFRLMKGQNNENS